MDSRTVHIKVDDPTTLLINFLILTVEHKSAICWGNWLKGRWLKLEKFTLEGQRNINTSMLEQVLTFSNVYRQI